jgi:hypothetical protein
LEDIRAISVEMLGRISKGGSGLLIAQRGWMILEQLAFPGSMGRCGLGLYS